MVGAGQVLTARAPVKCWLSQTRPSGSSTTADTIRPVLALQRVESKRARKRGGVLVQDDQGLEHAFHLGVGERVTGVGSLLVQAGPEGVGLDYVCEFLRVISSHASGVAA